MVVYDNGRYGAMAMAHSERWGEWRLRALASGFNLSAFREHADPSAGNLTSCVPGTTAPSIGDPSLHRQALPNAGAWR